VGQRDMSRPHEPDHVKLISSLFSPEKEFLDTIIKQLEKICGPVDWLSPELFFDRTKYYAKEMDWPLHRRFIAFEKLAHPGQLIELKLKTNAIEQQYLVDGNRRVNIDPGYISPERLILATGKNFVHRVYLSQGIYADLTLIFQKGCFKTLEWTYPDYADPEIIGYFNEVRKRYMKQLREGKELEDID
jgi:hypothetical protein